VNGLVNEGLLTGHYRPTGTSRLAVTQYFG
jgi:hypothetical protein